MSCEGLRLHNETVQGGLCICPQLHTLGGQPAASLARTGRGVGRLPCPSRIWASTKWPHGSLCTQPPTTPHSKAAVTAPSRSLNAEFPASSGHKQLQGIKVWLLSQALPSHLSAEHTPGTNTHSTRCSVVRDSCKDTTAQPVLPVPALLPSSLLPKHARSPMHTNRGCPAAAFLG